MEYLIIAVISLLASGLTLFSGFGLGTILMPVFAIFFPVPIAIALTAIVHFLNNFFKLILLGCQADKNVVMRFGLTAAAAAVIGAKVLLGLEGISPLLTYYWGKHLASVTIVKLVVASVMVVFALFEISPRFKNSAFDQRLLPLGGLLSGFFGGLSGHQGALRSAFLINCGLSKESFIATGVVVAVLVDIARSYIYLNHFSMMNFSNEGVLLIAVVAAFLGTFLGNRLVKKVTIRFVQLSVSVMLFVLAILLASGMI